MKSVDIKVLRAGDDMILANVADDLFDDPIHAAATRTFLEDPRHHVIVALDDRLVVGFVTAVHYAHPDKPGPELWINEVGVAPTRHRRGIATALLKATFDHARALGCSEAWVLTERDNDAAMRLYASAGGAASDAVMFTFDLST
jgi:ribosomal protein S18 acetylase RimI-like enzyme